MALAALVIFVVIVVAILLGYPVAVCLGGVALVAGYVLLGPAFMQFLPSRIIGTFSNYVLLAVPMFVLMGTLLQRSGLAAVLMQAAAQLLGRTPGGLGLAVLAVGALLAASTGIVGASVVTLALIALPAMERAGYHRAFASGVVAGAGTLGQIVPPSIVLVLLGSVMQVSVGDLFAAAVVPSLVLVVAYGLLIVATAIARPRWVPALSAVAPSGEPQSSVATHHTGSDPSLAAARAPSGKTLWLGIVGPLLLIGVVLGSILAGAASPTEAAGLGAVLALGLLLASGRGSLREIEGAAVEALRLTSMVYLILLGATTFALVFRGLGGDDVLVEAVTGAGLDAMGFVLVLLVVVFVAGFFIDFIEITFIVVPVALPLVQAYGIDPLWLSVLLAVNLQTSFLTPPFGFSLFYLRGAAPASYSTGDIYRGAVPYVAIQLALLGVLVWRPGWFGLG